MECICATYELNRKARTHGADTAKISNDPCDFDLLFLTWKWYATHRHLMGFICAIYQAIRSDRHEAAEQT